MEESKYRDAECGIIKQIKEERLLDIFSKLQDYMAVRENLIIRPMNAGLVDLSDAIYDTIGDIALVLYMVLAEKEDTLYSTRIRRDQFSAWNRKKEEVMADALQNTRRIAPPRIYHLEDMLMGEGREGEDFMDQNSDFSPSMSPVGDCLSTSTRINGAIAAFYPGVALRLASLMGESFYLAFTSVHEAMIHRESLVDPGILKEILKETIQEATEDRDILTYGIFQYNREKGSFCQVT